uniref:Uncharacterized protein n=1 Tax=Tanacetum cinerariifolium TaxID=118510 RepID=A0A699I775_TANCI|nr:hypothetical protein [Tanacetum cinerariifolium]
MYEPLEENTDVVSEDESKAFEQGMSTDTDDDKPVVPNPQHEKEELSPDEDLDEWLNAEMEKHMFSQQGIGIGGLLDPLSCSKKVLSGHNHIGYTVTDIITT